MNNQFDELAKGLAQSVTRRAVLRRFGLGLAGVVLATLGFTSQAHAGRGGNKRGKRCNRCIGPNFGCDPTDGACIEGCLNYCCGCTG